MVHGLRRDRTKEAFWRRMMRRQVGSGLSIRAWCLKHHLRESAFYWWRKQLAQRDARSASLSEHPAKTRSTSFLPVRVTDSKADTLDEDDGATCGGALIEIVFPDRWCVRIRGPVDGQVLADVLAVLESTDRSAELASC